MQHQQAERRSVLHVRARAGELKRRERGWVGTETQEGTCILWPDHPGTATAARCWFSNWGLAVEGQLRSVGALRVMGRSGGGVCPGPSW